MLQFYYSKHTQITFNDYKRAFDTVVSDALQRKMIQTGVSCKVVTKNAKDLTDVDNYVNDDIALLTIDHVSMQTQLDSFI